jgi:hypothetical protein
LLRRDQLFFSKATGSVLKPALARWDVDKKLFTLSMNLAFYQKILIV